MTAIAIHNEMHEEIVLESREQQSRALQARHSDIRQYQAIYAMRYRSGRKKMQRTLRLFDKHFLEDEKCHLASGKNESVVYHLGFLLATPVKRFRYNPWALACSTISGAMFATGIALALPLAAVSAALALGGLSALWLYFSVRGDTYFVSRAARAPLCAIRHQGLGGEARAFAEACAQAIRQSPLPKDLNALAEETKLLREMQEKSFITRPQYERYRQVIFSRYPKPSS